MSTAERAGTSAGIHIEPGMVLLRRTHLLAERMSGARAQALSKLKAFATEHVTELANLGRGENEDHLNDFTTDHAKEIGEVRDSLIKSRVGRPAILDSLTQVVRDALPTTNDPDEAKRIANGICDKLIFHDMDQELGRRALVAQGPKQ